MSLADQSDQEDSVVFSRLKASLGAGVSVDTVLTNPNVTPGGILAGEVRFTGGKVDYEVEGITLTLGAKVEVESGDEEYNTWMEFHRAPAAGRFVLTAGAAHAVPFQVAVPWETPVTAVFGQRLRGMSLGLRTELALDKALDKHDSDAIEVHALPAQQALLDGLARLGFGFRGADLEQGRLYGSTLPFFQEIEFYGGGRYARRINELELTFIARESSMDVLLEIDKRGGFLSAGHDSYNRFTVDYAEAQRLDWESWLDQRFSALTGR
jgi:sporulation-control protein